MDQVLRGKRVTVFKFDGGTGCSFQKYCNTVHECVWGQQPLSQHVCSSIGVEGYRPMGVCRDFDDVFTEQVQPHVLNDFPE